MTKLRPSFPTWLTSAMWKVAGFVSKQSAFLIRPFLSFLMSFLAASRVQRDPMNRAPVLTPLERISPERAQSIIVHHTTAEEAGQVFSRTKPKLAVYSHIVLPSATEQDLIPPTRRTYSGPLEVGEDLMVIEVDENVQVRRPARTAP